MRVPAEAAADGIMTRYAKSAARTGMAQGEAIDADIPSIGIYCTLAGVYAPVSVAL